MAELNENHNEAAQKTWKRRGVFTAAAALIAAVVGKVTEQRVIAGTDGDVVLGGSNTETTTTTITNISEIGTGLVVNCTNGMSTGLTASGSHFGVIGTASETGVLGRAIGCGVCGSADPGVGVSGQSTTGTGVVGTSGSGIAVYGQVPPSSSVNTVAIYGLNSSSYTGAAPGAGGFAIYGVSANGHSLVGAAATAGAGAVVGATNGVAGAYAGVFFGPVVVGGTFTVFGAKSAAVPHTDGTHRRMYCVESPESWFEDFGKGQLECGQAKVAIDADFAAVVDLSDYHVFLTAYDEDHLLHVANQTPGGFTVQAKDASTGGHFSWRVVARRKDIAAPRFETVEVPPEPHLPNIPEAPAAPTPLRSRASAFRKDDAGQMR